MLSCSKLVIVIVSHRTAHSIHLSLPLSTYTLYLLLYEYQLTPYLATLRNGMWYLVRPQYGLGFGVGCPKAFSKPNPFRGAPTYPEAKTDLY